MGGEKKRVKHASREKKAITQRGFVLSFVSFFKSREKFWHDLTFKKKNKKLDILPWKGGGSRLYKKLVL